MFVHKWFDPVLGSSVPFWIKECELIDGGELGVLPIATPEMVLAARPPFTRVAVQFAEGPDNLLVIFHQEPEDPEIYNVLLALHDASYKFWGETMWRWEKAPDGSRWNLFCEVSFLGPEPLDPSSFWSYVDQAWNLFALMAFSNVLTHDHAPSSRLNRARQHAGLMPLVTYKTLEIIVPHGHSGGDPHGGHHASPRVHLRRGFVRHLKNERTTWIRPAVVGQKHGLVLKEYQVKPALDDLVESSHLPGRESGAPTTPSPP